MLSPGARRAIFSRPGWVPQGASLAFDFTQGLGWDGGVKPASSFLTTTRSSTADYADDLGGIFRQFGANQPRITSKGLLVEEARTNVVLWNRDLTNAAWTPSNVTPLKNLVGVDGIANSASRITADANAGTITQAITLASSARWQSVFCRRITGTGTLEMSMDGGTTYTDITPASTDWTRKVLATQTLANPEPRFRIQTSGDAFGIDFVQNENSGAVETSPILVTTVAVARALDAVSIPIGRWFNAAAGTLMVEFASPVLTSAGARQIAGLDDTTTGNIIRLGVRPGGTFNAQVTTATVAQADLTPSGSIAAAAKKNAIAYAANDIVAVSAGGSVVADTSASIPTVTQITLGTLAGATALDGYISKLAYWPVRVPDGQLKAVTA